MLLFTALIANILDLFADVIADIKYISVLFIVN